MLVGISNDLNCSVRISFQVFSSVVNAHLLAFVDLVRIDAEEYYVWNVNIFSNCRSNFRTIRARFRSFSEFFVFCTKSVDLAVQIVDQVVIHQLGRGEFLFSAKTELQSGNST
ncbi:hypothetical protein SDC9_153042 [bioreactor metagenome]|uniref:Uncharacterized protein n=1 Tax=bioreactor metagenome TaxID=1076179 RepID=A0A645EX79_9ZZZZ